MKQHGVAALWVREPSLSNHCNYHLLVKSGHSDEELKQIILDHYTDESQLLTTGAEFNLLRFKEMVEWSDEEEQERLAYIRKTFQRNKALGTVEEGDPMSRLMGQINVFNDQFSDFIEVVDERLALLGIFI